MRGGGVSHTGVGEGDRDRAAVTETGRVREHKEMKRLRDSERARDRKTRDNGRDSGQQNRERERAGRGQAEGNFIEQEKSYTESKEPVQQQRGEVGWVGDVDVASQPAIKALWGGDRWQLTPTLSHAACPASGYSAR